MCSDVPPTHSNISQRFQTVSVAFKFSIWQIIFFFLSEIRCGGVDFISNSSAPKQIDTICAVSLCVLQPPVKVIGISSFVAPGATAGACVLSMSTSGQAVKAFQSQPIRTLCPSVEKSQRSAGSPVKFTSRTKMSSTRRRAAFVCSGSRFLTN